MGQLRLGAIAGRGALALLAALGTPAPVAGSLLAYASYLGGSAGDGARAVLTDATGGIYVAGGTTSLDFPVPGGVQQTNGGLGDAFVAGLDPAGTSVVFATYLGGRASDGVAGVQRDAASNLYLFGQTESSDFPLMGSLQPTLRGQSDFFLTKLAPGGSQILFSTLIGGDGFESATGLALDPGSGNLHLTGNSASNNFPTRSAIQASHPNPGVASCVIAGLSADLSGLFYATYFGGSLGASCNAIAVGAGGNVWVVGGTPSMDMTLVQPLQLANAGAADAFFIELDPTGSSLLVSSYLGGGGTDTARATAVDDSGRLHLAGTTASDPFPVMNPIPPGPRGSGDLFVARLSPAGTSLESSSVFGGSRDDQDFALAIDAAGGALLTGRTVSTDLPACDPTQALNGGGSEDAFVARVDLDRPALSLGTYMGGNDRDFGQGLAVTPAGEVLVVGLTESADFPTQDALRATLSGTSDAFVARIALSPCGAPVGNSLHVVRRLPGSIELDWLPVVSATGHVAREDQVKDGSFATVTARPAVSPLLMPVPAPPLLFLRVTAESCCGEGPL